MPITFMLPLICGLQQLPPSNTTKAPFVNEVHVLSEKDGYSKALVAAAHNFVKNNELEFLNALIEKEPKLLESHIEYIENHKPESTDSYTLLHRAVSNRKHTIARYLIEKGAKLEAKAYLDWTPLHMAVIGGDLEMVKLLVEKGSNIQAKTAAAPASPGSGDLTGYPSINPAIEAKTVMQFAKLHNHTEIINYLNDAMKNNKK